jgi:recombinational DNA repair ATPase RecF
VATARREFERFMSVLGDDEASADVRRLANLVLANFDELARLGVAHGLRSRHIVELAHESFEATPPEIGPNVAIAEAGTSWNMLHALTVGPFRGFTRPEPFDLSRRLTLIYGPNGSGKSSFCEAIEFALTGTVGEADARRMGANEFFVNARVGHFERPVLTATFRNGRVATVEANEEAWGFCLVERNRIDDFARLAAKQPGARERLIAALFGVAPFDTFVRSFNEQIDAYLDLEGVRRTELRQRRTVLAADQQLVDSELESTTAIAAEERNIANEFREGMTFAQLGTFLGTTHQPGRIQELRRVLVEQVPAANGATTQALAEARHEANARRTELLALQQILARRKDEISFHKLYEAVLQLQETSPDRCPACDTPLAGERAVIADPFRKAEEGLKELAELARVDQQYQEAMRTAARACKLLRKAVARLLDFARRRLPTLPGILEVLEGIPEDGVEDWWSAWDQDETATWELLDAVAEYIERDDADMRVRMETRAELEGELERLEIVSQSVLRQEIRRSEISQRVEAARIRIAGFEDENADLIAAAAGEPRIVALNQRIKRAYDSFLRELREHRDALPGILLADLNERAMELYNAVNRDDPPGDRMVALRLPLRVDERIEVAFESAPGTMLDALHILSEGHVRCLGLAILLAKNLVTESPLLVLDDIVNAIDDDHRNGIRSTLFEDGLFQQKQIIVTCHGEEFIKSIQNHLGAAALNDACTLYDFLPHRGDHMLRIETPAQTRNYIVRAREHFERAQLRDSLGESRRALEAATNRLWIWLRNKGRGEIKVKLTGPKARPELYDLTQALLTDLNDRTFEHNRKAALSTALGELLGIQPARIEWNYLNGGTHEAERDGEFDRAIVQRIVQALEALDAALV